MIRTFRTGFAILLGLVVVAAPGLQAFQFSAAQQQEEHTCCCCCSCPMSAQTAKNAETDRESACSCSVSEPKTLPEGPLVAQQPPTPDHEFTADVTGPVDFSLALVPERSVPEQIRHASRHGPPLYVLYSAFLI